MTTIMTGSSGLLGSALTRSLRADGVRVVRLVRRAPQSADESFWNPGKGLVDPAALEGAEAVVHLAGAGIGDRRWTEEHRREVLRSRVEGTRTLVTALTRLSAPPAVLLSGSAVGYYGDTGDREVDESAPSGEGFLAEVVRAWEAEAEPAAAAGIRTATLRTGLVLSGEGGMLRRVLPIFKLGLGAPLGSGRQYWSWISVDDWVHAVRHVMGERTVEGPVNLTAPEPVTNAEFTSALARAVHRPAMPLPVPAPVLRAALGGFAQEGVLTGQRVLPRRLLDSGYAFRHIHLNEALSAVL
ncbi:TIGR01777 family oxidoreductase [Planomonospora parontospora]|uniref:TIGR01777 family oxidoreductase n=1 Tax=Planomonospora parontospora TaxID=58119 RepID=UPI0016702695|nr:TIGR01777 family oxidoreductase [Planomonospora parontospora]